MRTALLLVTTVALGAVAADDTIHDTAMKHARKLLRQYAPQVVVDQHAFNILVVAALSIVGALSLLAIVLTRISKGQPVVEFPRNDDDEERGSYSSVQL